jgi:hypothetical protein
MAQGSACGIVNSMMLNSELKRSAIERSFTRGLLQTITALGAVLLSAGCLDRPIGASTPVTTNVVVQKQANNAITGIDVLLMIDNSSSMADKQKVLADAVPQLLGQLVAPNCVDASGNSATPPVQALLGATNPCSQAGPGYTPEFNPVNNIHVGIVTSSLGDHGANSICDPGAPTQYADANGQPIIQPPDENDEGHLLGTLARGASISSDPQTQYASVNGAGFLAWGTSNLPTDVSATDLSDATTIFTDMVSATKEAGCGFEAQLEGWFRFLIDPVPPILPLQPPDTNSQTHRSGSDDALLNQRAAFLRPDSLVAIVMLTDENDCSVRDTDVGWVNDDVNDSIPTGSTQCASNPNDKCCYSCTAGAPSGCTATCPKPPPAGVDDGTYQANIRCWQQKRRFGYEFLYPKSRYVVGLTNKVLCPDQTFGDMDCDCTYAQSIGAPCSPGGRQLPNPLYSTTVGTLNNGSAIAGYPNSIARTDNSAIFLAAITGVPWQDIGTTDSNGNLVYIPVTDPAWTSGTAGTQPVNPGGTGIWDMIYGDDNANIMPHDIHMVESIVPRVAGQNVDGKAGSTNVIPNQAPWNTQSIPGPTAAVNADPLNGHEWNTALEDLEYACVAQLPTPRPCPCTPGSADYAGCKYLNPNDCCDLSYAADGTGGPGADYDKPLCESPAGGAPTTTQYYFKGYPALREIAVLHDYAVSSAAAVPGNSIVASICPKDLTSANTSPGYGYNPAVAALISRLKEKLKGSCLPRPLTVNADGTLPCSVVEVVASANLQGKDCASYCTSNQRGTPNAQMVLAVQDSMSQSKICDSPGQPACSAMCLCELPQETPGTNLTTCQNAIDGTENTSIPPGYCYVDPANGAGNTPSIVAKCPATEPRILRFVGNNPSGGGSPVPLPGAFVFTACEGSAISATPVASSLPTGDAGP